MGSMGRLRRTTWVLGLFSVLVGCASDPPKEEGSKADGKANSFPGYDPPPVAELVKTATKKAPPKEEPEPYEPRQVDVPPLEPLRTSVLPPTGTGKPLLFASHEGALIVDETLSDPITAAASCMQLVTTCIQPPTVKNGRERDSCMKSARTCESNHPWDEAEACCSAACKDVYEKLRTKGYSRFEAWKLTRTGNCFPGLGEFMTAAKKNTSRGEAP